MARFETEEIDPMTTSGIALALYLNEGFDAIVSSHLGSGDPDYLEAGLMFLDNATPALWDYKVAIDDETAITLFQIDTDDERVVFDVESLDYSGSSEDDILAIVSGVPAWATIASIGVDLATDVTGELATTHLPAALRIGTDDSVQGSLYLYGDSSTSGGLFRLYNAASEDTTLEYWAIEANDSLRIGPNTAAGALTLTASLMSWAQGEFRVGVSDSTAALVRLYGDSGSQGARLLMYNSATTEDDTYDYFILEANTHLQLGPNTDTDAFIFGGDGGFYVGGSVGPITLSGASINARIRATMESALTGFSANMYHASVGASVSLTRARGSYASPTVVSSGDIIGGLFFQAFDGTDFENAASIQAYVDNTPGSNDMPGMLAFYTTPDGSATSREVARITSDAIVRGGVSGTLRGHFHATRGTSTNTPGVYRLESFDGTSYYLFVTNAGQLRISSTLPTAAGDGAAV